MLNIRSLVWISFFCLTAAAVPVDEISAHARKLHFSSIVLDTHDDTTQRFFIKDFDLGSRNPGGHIDIPPAIQKALDQIDSVHENVRRFSKDMQFARTAADIRRAQAQG